MVVSEETHIFWIDLFCGAGGTTSGIHLAGKNDEVNTKVVACVNHDEKAILSHLENHPDCIHFTEDIRDFEVVIKLKKLVIDLRSKYPNCLINIWASLECTNFSKAKGGLPRDGDSRTLAEHMKMYIAELAPDYLWIENVIEFMSWGPLDGNGKPISKNRGRDYIKWVDMIKSYGYNFDWKQLNSADFGAYTSRSRYFAQFPKEGLPISWPVKTHTKNPSKEKNLFEINLKKWMPVKDVLNLDNEGNSIFNRKKPLVDNTLKRIYAGLIKFVAKGDETFIKKYYSGRPEGKVISINGPAGTVTTANGQGIVKCDFILKYNSTNKSGKHNPPGIEDPCPTVAAQSRLGLINANFLQSYYGNGQSHSEEEPCPTVSTKDRFGKVNYLMMNYSKSQSRPIDYPAATIVNNDKHNLVSVESGKDHYLMNPQYKCEGHALDKPSPTIIARQDKKPLGLITCDKALGFSIPVYNDDSETMVQIKQFMAYYGIIDIKMRMLEVLELLRIQGFPAGYKLVGNQTDQKKFIGNSVEVTIARSIVTANYIAIVEHLKSAA